mgnify:CR=1 FL=1|jgi:hypothetical protein
MPEFKAKVVINILDPYTLKTEKQEVTIIFTDRQQVNGMRDVRIVYDSSVYDGINDLLMSSTIEKFGSMYAFTEKIASSNAVLDIDEHNVLNIHIVEEGGSFNLKIPLIRYHKYHGYRFRYPQQFDPHFTSEYIGHALSSINAIEQDVYKLQQMQEFNDFKREMIDEMKKMRTDMESINKELKELRLFKQETQKKFQDMDLKKL